MAHAISCTHPGHRAARHVNRNAFRCRAPRRRAFCLQTRWDGRIAAGTGRAAVVATATATQGL